MMIKAVPTIVPIIINIPGNSLKFLSSELGEWYDGGILSILVLLVTIR